VVKAKRTPAASPTFIQPDDWEAICRELSLSRRESEVAGLILREYDEADIAARLTIAPRTAHAHIEKMYRKLSVHNRCQLVVRFFREYVRRSKNSTED
jgi:DNA-binding NarL/FixJ family response regulator